MVTKKKEKKMTGTELKLEILKLEHQLIDIRLRIAEQERIDAEKSLNSVKDEYHKLCGVDCKPKEENK